MYQNENEEYLAHYGVKGMRWGVRRNIKRMSSAKTQDDYDKAVSSLKKHREKASNEIVKLERKRPKLEKKVEKHIMKTDHKVSKMDTKAAKLTKKANSVFRSDRKSAELLMEASAIRMKSDALKAKSQQAKQMLSENTTMINAFKKGINDIDTALIEKGRRYVAA